jgi:hypothetical protein
MTADEMADAFFEKRHELPLEPRHLGSLDSLVRNIREGFWSYEVDRAILTTDYGMRVQNLDDGRFVPIE